MYITKTKKKRESVKIISNLTNFKVVFEMASLNCRFRLKKYEIHANDKSSV